MAELLVKYRGFKGEEPAWLSLEELVHDIPALLQEYLSDRSDKGLKKQRALDGALSEQI